MLQGKDHKRINCCDTILRYWYYGEITRIGICAIVVMAKMQGCVWDLHRSVAGENCRLKHLVTTEKSFLIPGRKELSYVSYIALVILA